MDARDREAEYGPDYTSFDPKRMVLSFELVDTDEDSPTYDEEITLEFPAEYQVCSLCHGQGKHVNPSIDAHGISAEEFYDDPDFAEDYLSGTYDVECYRCHGLRVQPEIVAEKELSEEQRKNLRRLEEYQREEAAYRAECEMERRMGA